MIPTRYKQKLPKDLSYPLGAKEVSQALAAVPQFDSLILMFRDRPNHSAMTFRKMLEAGTPYPILTRCRAFRNGWPSRRR